MGRPGHCLGELGTGDLVSLSGESDCDGKGADVPEGLVASFTCRDSLEMIQTLKKRCIGSLSQNHLISVFLMF